MAQQIEFEFKSWVTLIYFATKTRPKSCFAFVTSEIKINPPIRYASTPVYASWPKSLVLQQFYFRNFSNFSIFSGLFSTCFETSIWNIVYTSSRLQDTTGLSIIAIGTLWTTLQPKIGHFVNSWPHKLYKSFKLGIYTYTISLLILLLFVMVWQLLVLWWLKNTHKTEITKALHHRKVFKIVCMWGDINLKLGQRYMHPVSGIAHRVFHYTK